MIWTWLFWVQNQVQGALFTSSSCPPWQWWWEAFSSDDSRASYNTSDTTINLLLLLLKQQIFSGLWKVTATEKRPYVCTFNHFLLIKMISVSLWLIGAQAHLIMYRITYWQHLRCITFAGERGDLTKKWPSTSSLMTGSLSCCDIGWHQYDIDN